MNALQNEKSPYLLQHSQNPVNWYPWCDEAFETAKREDKPVFLSIGYSTCHWCHVMARESFENQNVAALLNRSFIAVKVDREERPDIDAVYMDACMALTGSGGWPLTILMTPEQKPFWAGTYLPASSRYGALGLTELLETAADQWQRDRAALLQAGEKLTELISQKTPSTGKEPSRELLKDAVQALRRSFDRVYGGFGKAPKFPSPHNLIFLMRYASLEQDPGALEMALCTLDGMARGGIMDHVGGGFSRYSTDRQWLAPHFEKMLYDNALLALAYLEAYRITKKEIYRSVLERTLDYVLRELTDAKGGFYSGQDADSEGVEGKYYLVTPKEIQNVLGEKDGMFFCAHYGITPKGNFESKNIPNRILAEHWEEEPEELEGLRRRVYQWRRGRVRLHRDDKVLTSWNALMIAAMAAAGALLEHPRYLTAAKSACSFLETNLTGEQNRLYLRWRDGEAGIDGQLDDYSFYAGALLLLYHATLDMKYLALAETRTRQMLTLFEDDDGGFFLTAADSPSLITRPKELYDGALPSGNAAAAWVLARLARLTGEPFWQDAADRQLRYLAGQIKDAPAGHTASLLAMAQFLYPTAELLCVTGGTSLPSQAVRYLQQHPKWSVLLKTPQNENELSALAPFTRSYPVPETGVRYYLCRSGACLAPFSTLNELQAYEQGHAGDMRE